MAVRNEIRARRSQILRRAKAKGVNLADLQTEGRSPTKLIRDVTNLLNDAIPRPTRQRLRVDDPVVGAFNGVNTSFTLTGTPTNPDNVMLVHTVQATGVATVLTRVNASSPAAGQWYWTGTSITVGTAPAAADSLIAAYIVAA